MGWKSSLSKLRFWDIIVSWWRWTMNSPLSFYNFFSFKKTQRIFHNTSTNYLNYYSFIVKYHVLIYILFSVKFWCKSRDRGAKSRPILNMNQRLGHKIRENQDVNPKVTPQSTCQRTGCSCTSPTHPHLCQTGSAPTGEAVGLLNHSAFQRPLTPCDLGTSSLVTSSLLEH